MDITLATQYFMRLTVSHIKYCVAKLFFLVKLKHLWFTTILLFYGLQK